MKQVNLFGEEQEIYIKPKHEYKSEYQKIKKKNNYKKSSDKYNRCGLCERAVKVEGHNRNYYKCKLIGISKTEATDIGLFSKCDMFKRGWEKGYVMKKVPVLIRHDWNDAVGFIEIDLKNYSVLEGLADQVFVLEPSFIVNKDGKHELVEVSIVSAISSRYKWYG